MHRRAPSAIRPEQRLNASRTPRFILEAQSLSAPTEARKAHDDIIIALHRAQISPLGCLFWARPSRGALLRSHGSPFCTPPDE